MQVSPFMARQSIYGFVALMLLCALNTQAQQVMLLGKDLQSQPTAFMGLSDEGISTADRTGKTSVRNTDEIVRVSFTQLAQAAMNEDAAIATLVDGQVLVGPLLGPGKDGESIRMALPVIGKAIDLALDDLVSITLPGGQAMQPNQEDDTIMLATGETLVGFVETIGADTIGFVVGDADDPIEIPFERVRGLTIANKPKPIEFGEDDRLIRVVLWDGSVWLLKSAKTMGASMSSMQLTGVSTLPLDDATVTLAIRDVARIEPFSASHRLERLSAFAFEVVEGGAVFGVEMPPRLTPDNTLQIHAPITLRFDLPDDTARLSFQASIALPDDIAPSRRALAGCELVVYDGQQAIQRVKLEPDTPPQRINLPLTSGDLRLELDPGVNGPVLDRVLLSDAELLVDTNTNVTR